MNNLIILGQHEASRKFIEEFIHDNNFAQYDVHLFNEKIKIEHARVIKKTLSFRQPRKLLFVFFDEVTLEAQNALLKSIEEHADNIYFAFCAEKEDSLLPTIVSRCLVKNLASEGVKDAGLLIITKDLFEKSTWHEMDRLLEYLNDKPLDMLVPVLRALIFENLHDLQMVASYYAFCKKLLVLLPLSEFNNVSKKVVIENAFFY
jgi:DNA polymerase III delta prime subunit